MKSLKMMMLMVTAMTLSACDYIEKRDYERDRGDRGYKNAMSDMNAGKMDSAIEGFKKVIRANPSNTSARFQLACLQQDVVKDYAQAFSNYQQFMLLDPTSDKLAIAEERLKSCERELAKQLAMKYGIISSNSTADERKRLEDNLKKLQEKDSAAQKRLAALEEENLKLKGENERIKKQYAATGLEDKNSVVPTIDRAALLDEVDEAIGTSRFSDEEIAMLKDDMDEERAEGFGGTEKIYDNEDLEAPGISEEARDLRDDTDELDSKPPIKVDQEKVKQVKDARSEKKKSKASLSLKNDESKVETKPDTYVVEAGDTLYKIAIRFYGKQSAAEKIRDANKATISTDYRIRPGQVIRLP